MLSGTRSALAPCPPAPKLLHRRREGFDRERGDLANVRHGLQPSKMSTSFDMEAIRAFRALDPVGHQERDLLDEHHPADVPSEIGHVGLGALLDELLTCAECHRPGLLVGRFRFHEPHRSSAD